MRIYLEDERISFALQNQETQVEIRSFAPLERVHEDSVCGSGNGAVAVLIKKHHLLDQVTYTASQGQKAGRAGIKNVNLDSNPNWRSCRRMH